MDGERRVSDAGGREKSSPAMINLLFVLAAILVIGWGYGYSMNLHRGGMIHLLLVLAVITVLVRVILGRRAV